jgi:hypothetical protein
MYQSICVLGAAAVTEALSCSWVTHLCTWLASWRCYVATHHTRCSPPTPCMPRPPAALPPRQVPTQDFFSNQFGLPLTMKPDFATLSCDMVFGAAPPPIQQDEVYNQPCLAPCSLAQGNGSCPKVDDTQRVQQQQQQQPDAPGRVAAAARQGASS